MFSEAVSMTTQRHGETLPTPGHQRTHLAGIQYASWSRYLHSSAEFGSLAANLSLSEAPAGSYPDAANDDLTVHMILAGDCWMTIDLEARRREIHVVPGALTMTPPNAPCDFRLSDRFACVGLGLNFALFSQLMVDSCQGKTTEFRPNYDLTFYDPLIEQLLRSLVQHLTDPSPATASLRDSLVLTVAQTLICKFAGTRAVDPDRVGLTTGQVAVIAQYIRSHLHEPIYLAQLSKLLKLSPFPFARRFKLKTGLAPHQFVQRERVRYVLARLAKSDGNEALAQIAADAGFSDQAHLCRVIRKRTGRTPSVIRRQARL
jgi:AraC family transcriptional regulator